MARVVARLPPFVWVGPDHRDRHDRYCAGEGAIDDINEECGGVHVLDNPVWHALTGPQRSFGTTGALAAMFHPDISPFGAFADPTSDHSRSDVAWSELAGLAGPGATVSLTGDPGRPPRGWTVLREVAGVQMQMLGGGAGGALDTGAEPLGLADVPDMLDLVERARPGPFVVRTVALGGYLGLRHEGRLVAMAGERLRPPGFAEISAVATAPDYRSQGLASRLVRAVAAGIAARGEIPFLHAAVANAGAIRLYEALGFSRRRAVAFVIVKTPERG